MKLRVAGPRLKPGAKPKPLIERLLAKVDKQPDGGCWLWTGGVNGGGYGKITRGAGDILAHRAAWELFVGPIPDGMCVLHDCPDGDNPACCNPSHLWLGSHAQNAADRVAKGRSARGDAHWTRLHPEKMARGDRHGMRLHPEKVARGDRNSSAKLTAAKVREIRKQAARGVSQRAIGAMFGVSQTAVRMIITGRTWKHVV